MLRDDILKSFLQGGDPCAIEAPVLAEIFDAIPLQIVVKSLREENFGEFLVWNKEAEMILGIRADEAVGHRDAEFFPDDQVGFFQEKDRHVVLSGQPLLIPAETIFSRTRGMRTLRTVKTPIYNSDGRPVALLAVSEDITERKSTEWELQQALDFLNNINSQLPGAVFQFRVDAQGRSNFPYVSEGIRLISGDDAAEIMSGSRNLMTRIIPEDLPAYLAGIARSRREMSHCRQEFRLATDDGQIRWIMSSSLPKPQPDGSTIWHGFLSDVTALHETSEALRRGEDRLHSALEATNAAAWELSMETGGIYLSPEWGRLFGFPEDQFPRTFAEVLDFFHPDDQHVAETIRHNGGPAGCGQLEFRHLRGDGSYLWTLISGKVVHDAYGSPVRQVGTMLDISERKRIERQLIEAKEHAEHASHAKGDFLAMMSHEIRTPLNAVLGFSELLASTNLTKEQADYLRTIQDNSSALLVVLNDVLDYSKIESGKLDLNYQPVEIPKIIRAAVEVFRPQAASRGVKMHAVFSRNVPEFLLCDPARLSQIIHNLLSNAVKFTERGEILVELSLEGEPEAGTIPVRLRIRDTGIGIPSDRQASLFEPFYQADSTTRRHHGGTGLGLTIIKRLVELMQGSINVASEANVGTTFTVVLPLAEPDPDEETSERELKRMSINISGLTKRILIVEDNATNRRLVQLFLKNLGYRADEAPSGFEGVEMAGRSRYDVILMDLEMPGMDGYEAAQLIRANAVGRMPYIIALTAHAMPEHRQRSFDAGMNAYLSKPLKKTDLANALRDAFRA